ncbi:GNAT family N-acetyltransferase [Curtobacterium sp. VKM Ac-2887]|nr:GNAT family N-acetyltransferase [Curtobacterium sp. VKM Ac-2887]
MDGAPVEVRHIVSDVRPPEWPAVLELAKVHRSTLGFLTDSAFMDRVRRGTLVVAEVEGTLVGYCLYDVPRPGYIKLVHVCVGARGRSIGKLLVDAAIEAHPGATGVVAYCRRDYGLDRFWSSVGLSPRGERPGRALSGSVLTRWWMQLGDLDLLEDAALGAGRPLVVYDTNIVTDLFGSLELVRPDREASLGLLADWFQAEVTPVLSTQVDVELDRIDDQAERARQRDAIAHITRLRSLRHEGSGVLKELLRSVGEVVLAADPSLRDDLCHVADALTAGAAYLVTNDTRLLNTAPAALPADSSLKILRPHEVVRAIDERLGQPLFQSRLIEAVDLRWSPATEFPMSQLVDAFVSHDRGERGKDLTRALRAAIAQHPRSTRVLADQDNRTWALLAEHRAGGELRVPIVRVARGEAASTVALQLARHTRHIARQNELSEVLIDDQNLSEMMRESLLADGFREDDTMHAALINAPTTLRDFVRAHPDIPLEHTGHLRDVERRFWPLALIRTNAPTYIVPIQPRFIYPLFGAPRDTLVDLDRPRALGLSREHVYYSGSSRSLPTRGSRIIWYATADQTEQVRAVVAYSRSLGCERMRPGDAYRANRQIGVLGRDHVHGAADKYGRVTVVRFEDTEVLPTPVGGRVLQDLFAKRGVKQPIQSFRRVPSAVFDDLIMSQRSNSE